MKYIDRDELVTSTSTERRRRDRRKAQATCQRCAGTLRLVGQPGYGVQILKCEACGNMDRRLPTNRREFWAEPVGRFWTRPLVLALELLAILAIAAAVAVALRGAP